MKTINRREFLEKIKKVTNTENKSSENNLNNNIMRKKIENFLANLKTEIIINLK